MLKVNNSPSDNVDLFYYEKGFLPESLKFKYVSGAYEIAMSLFLFAVMLLSVVGNLCTCAVIIRDRTMRTPTNYYLFNLAIADLTTAMFIPIEITVLWIPDLFGKITGHIVFLFWDLLCHSSVLTILALTIERYIVISKPFLRHTFVLSSRVFKILAVNWVIAASFCILNVFYIYNIEEHKNVYIYFNSQPSSHVVLLMATEVIIFFIFPMMVIIMLYALIILKLKTNLPLRHTPTVAKQNRSKAIKLLGNDNIATSKRYLTTLERCPLSPPTINILYLLNQLGGVYSWILSLGVRLALSTAIAASFFVCWSPYCILRIMAIVPELRQKNNIDYWQIFSYLNCINSYASTAVNPILYSVMSRKFRHAFKELLKRNRQ